MFDFLFGIAQRIKNLGATIVSGIKDVLVEIFVPSEDYLTAKWNSIRSRFAFADSITETVDIVVTFFKETAFDEPPTIKINLAHAESEKYDYGGETYVLDMHWYSRYKPIVDPFLSAWIWLVFLWRLFVKLPNIINGMGGDFEMAQKAYESRDYIKWSLKGGKK